MSYFIIPDIDALQTATGEQREQLARKLAACIGDVAALRGVLGIDPDEFADFYPADKAPELSTADTIDSFISIFSSEKAAATPVVEELVPEKKDEPESAAPAIPIAPAIDYAAMMLDDEEAGNDAPGDETSDLISSFLQNVPPKKPVKKSAEPAAAEPAAKAAPDTAPLTMNDFSAAVKDKDYNRALEIIMQLSLNNPKKSVYFASQMRFLKKLIKNEEKSAR